MEARWTPLLNDVKKGESQLRTEMIAKFVEKEKELSEVKERLKAVEDFLLERWEKAELKRALRESARVAATSGDVVVE